MLSGGMAGVQSLDWKTSLGYNRLDRRNNNFANRGESRRAYSNAIKFTVDSLLTHRSPWPWKKNSCHLDTFLMVELATYHVWSCADPTLDDHNIWDLDKEYVLKLLTAITSCSPPRFRLPP